MLVWFLIKKKREGPLKPNQHPFASNLKSNFEAEFFGDKQQGENKIMVHFWKTNFVQKKKRSFFFFYLFSSLWFFPSPNYPNCTTIIFRSSLRNICETGCCANIAVCTYIVLKDHFRCFSGKWQHTTSKKFYPALNLINYVLRFFCLVEKNCFFFKYKHEKQQHFLQ